MGRSRIIIKSMTNNQQFSSDLPLFRCISCLTPSPTLFKQYRSNATSTAAAAATAASIKLSPCSRCEKNVDPYCEREWLLVILDLVLLRHEAYRHVLYNRLQLLLATEENDSSSKLGMLHLKFHAKKQARPGHFGNFSVVLMALGAGFLQACLLWQAREARNEQVADFHDTINLVRYHARNFMYLVLRSLLGCGVFLLVLTCSWRKSLHLWNQHETKVFSNATRLFHALLLPYSFHLATLLMHTIWENTITVLLLGSVLVLVYQFMAVVAATETLNQTANMRSGEETTMSQAKDDRLEHHIMSSNTLAVFLALGTAVILRAILDAGLDNIFWHPNSALPCLGFSVNILRHDLCLMV